jgi:hypothetical protein
VVAIMCRAQQRIHARNRRTLNLFDLARRRDHGDV